MKRYRLSTLAVCLLVSNSPLHAQATETNSTLAEDICAIKWETASVFTASTILGITKWDWGTRSSFTSHSEGWFSRQTDYGGADKLGHAFTTYTITNVLTERLILQGRSPRQAAGTSALISSTLQLYVELMDGFSNKYGFSYEDMGMNLLGAAFAYTRHAQPGLRDLVDFRIEYEKSSRSNFDPVGDYSGQKYLLALKLAGMHRFHHIPLRYLELQAGYYTRGFSKTERAHDDARSRNAFVGIGINLTEVFFGRRAARESGYRRLGRGFFEHIQIPNTALQHRHAF